MFNQHSQLKVVYRVLEVIAFWKSVQEVIFGRVDFKAGGRVTLSAAFVISP